MKAKTTKSNTKKNTNQTRGLVFIGLLSGLLGVMSGSLMNRANSVTPETLDGQFAFDWLRSAPVCTEIDSKLMIELKRHYGCKNEEGVTVSGVEPSAACRSIDGRSEYLVFESPSDCFQELESQRPSLTASKESHPG